MLTSFPNIYRSILTKQEKKQETLINMQLKQLNTLTLLFSLSFLCVAQACLGAEDWFEGISDKLPNVSEDIQLLHQKMLAHKSDNQIEAAIDAALQIVDGLAEAPQQNLIRPLLNLALLQTVSGNADLAIENLLRSIELIESTEGAFSQQLIQPLYSLGSARRLTGDYEAAQQSF